MIPNYKNKYLENGGRWKSESSGMLIKINLKIWCRRLKILVSNRASRWLCSCTVHFFDSKSLLRVSCIWWWPFVKCSIIFQSASLTLCDTRKLQFFYANILPEFKDTPMPKTVNAICKQIIKIKKSNKISGMYFSS